MHAYIYIYIYIYILTFNDQNKARVNDKRSLRISCKTIHIIKPFLQQFLFMYSYEKKLIQKWLDNVYICTQNASPK